MAKLVYATIASLDGYVSDSDGNFDWAEPDEEMHRFVNDLERPIGTYLYGRRMYDVMRVWDTPEAVVDQQPFVIEYAELWRAADKVVYSTTLAEVSSARTRIERSFDPESVRRLKATSERDLSVGGPHLAAEAITHGLVDEFHVFAVPLIVGGDTRWLPDDIHVRLELLDEHRFASGVVHLHYRTSA